MQYMAQPPVKGKPTYVSYVQPSTHSIAIGYVVWFFFGLFGGHRFYYGKQLTGVIWFFTAGLLGIGWLVDAFLIPLMDDEADARYAKGPNDYNIAWLLFPVSWAIWNPSILSGQSHHRTSVSAYRRFVSDRIHL